MTTPTPDLRELLAKATPGPWEAQQPSKGDDAVAIGDDGVAIIGLRLGDDGTPIHTPTNGLVAFACQFPTEIEAGDFERALANANLIIAAVNDLPSHLDTIARLEARERELVEALGNMVRLADMGLEESLREPEERGNYVCYTRAKALLATLTPETDHDE